MKRGCQSLQEVLEQLSTQYEEQQRECTRLETAAERRLKLANLVSIGLANSKSHPFQSVRFYYHEPDKIAQVCFIAPLVIAHSNASYRRRLID
ncbi:hypothetical protein BVRB_039760 [Beta vulgaris subsp. vulgaris]|uniref:Uncharacterized protein n=1 Tax=Beta vulgaris subsp. vulgaris TaxID=3555 RepID=A0A0J7YNA6_BETVV|nr:hypothetical protein BVRB_039760 [Beta vulgaris subsp. vulgaris]